MPRKYVLLLAFSLLMGLSLAGCNPAPSEPPINSEEAIAIASSNVPGSILATANILRPVDIGEYWLVRFSVPDDGTFTRDELGWLEGPGTVFENIGFLPQDTFRTLSFRIDKQTGDILTRTATDSVPLGGPTSLG